MYYAPLTFVFLRFLSDKHQALLHDSAYHLLYDSSLDLSTSGLRQMPLICGHTAPSSHLPQSTFHIVFISSLYPCSTMNSLRSETSKRERVRGALESENSKLKSQLSHMLNSLDNVFSFSESQLSHLYNWGNNENIPLTVVFCIKK